MGAMGISLNTAAIDLFPQSRGGALSALHGLLGAGAAIWPMLVAATIDREIWPLAPFLLGAGFAMMLIGSATGPLRGLTDTVIEEHARTDLPPRLRWWTLTAGLYGVGESIFTVWAVVLLYERRQLPLPVAAGALSIFWVAMTGGRLVAAALLRRISAGPLALVLSAGMSASYLFVAGSTGAAGSLLAYAVAGLCCSALFPLLFSLASHEYPERTPALSAAFSAAVLFGLAVGSFGVGPLRGPLGLERVYLIAAVIPLCVAAILARLEWRAPRREVSEQN
jgi:fucose permease